MKDLVISSPVAVHFSWKLYSKLPKKILKALQFNKIIKFVTRWFAFDQFAWKHHNCWIFPTIDLIQLLHMHMSFAPFFFLTHHHSFWFWVLQFFIRRQCALLFMCSFNFIASHLACAHLEFFFCHNWTGKTTYSIILHLKLWSNVSMFKVLSQHKCVFLSSYLTRSGLFNE